MSDLMPHEEKVLDALRWWELTGKQRWEIEYKGPLDIVHMVRDNKTIWSSIQCFLGFHKWAGVSSIQVRHLSGRCQEETGRSFFMEWKHDAPVMLTDMNRGRTVSLLDSNFRFCRRCWRMIPFPYNWTSYYNFFYHEWLLKKLEVAKLQFKLFTGVEWDDRHEQQIENTE